MVVVCAADGGAAQVSGVDGDAADDGGPDVGAADGGAAGDGSVVDGIDCKKRFPVDNRRGNNRIDLRGAAFDNDH